MVTTSIVSDRVESSSRQEAARKRAALCAEIAESTWIDCFTRRYNESEFRALVKVFGLTALEEGWIRLQCETVLTQ